ncbi:alpha-E domain-containing protein [Pseudanabaenaceae cyanobacterium LEGE 13415]|nr:alpha-E domain-containing protein [Pseudanabaenaceae cyanobacterium LEGE 13415]
MLSRVADSIYWMNRYVERAENIARFIDVNLTLLLDSPIGVSQQWKPLVLTTGDLHLFEERYGEANANNVIRFLTFDRAYPNSIISCLNAARENARSIRYCIRQVERSLHQITGTPEGTWNTGVERCLGKLRADLDYLTIDDVMESGLHEFLDDLQRRMNEVGLRLSETFFAIQPVT